MSEDYTYQSSTGPALSEMLAGSDDCPCEIQWADGTEITDENRNVLPGHNIRLKIVCDGRAITEVQWTLPGITFTDYSIELDLSLIHI